MRIFLSIILTLLVSQQLWAGGSSDPDCRELAKVTGSRIYDVYWSYQRSGVKFDAETFEETAIIPYDLVYANLYKGYVAPSSDYRKKVTRIFDIYSMEGNEQDEVRFIARVHVSGYARTSDIQKNPPYGSYMSSCELEGVSFPKMPPLYLKDIVDNKSQTKP